MSCRQDPACSHMYAYFPERKSPEAHSVQCAREQYVREIAEWMIKCQEERRSCTIWTRPMPEVLVRSIAEELKRGQ